MTTRIDEIAPRVYRISTHVAHIAPPAGFTFNQFVVDADEPLLFHCGHRGMFSSISAAVGRLMPLARIRWLAFSHLEADECGAMNEWLASVPQAEVVHGALGCGLSTNDMADRRPRPLEDGEVVDLGTRRVRYLATPHLPHGWDAGLLYEEETRTLLCSDVLAQFGDGPALTGHDIVEAAIRTDEASGATSLTPTTGATLRRLAGLAPVTLAIMHGSSFTGDGAGALRGFADHFEARLRAAILLV